MQRRRRQSRALLIARILPRRPRAAGFRPPLLAFLFPFPVSPFGFLCRFPDIVIVILAVIAAGLHLFPSRTEKLSPPAPMVLHTSVGE